MEMQSDSHPQTRDDVHLKMLVPSCAAGAVIGKGGETIGKLQRDSTAKMKMSKNQDTFPGTSERVCLIVGTVSACQKAHEDVAQIIYDKPDPQPKPSGDGDGKINYQRHHQTKFLVPNASAGVIIGKGGAYIKELKESSGAHVNVSHKGENPERIVTVSGDSSEIRAAMGMLLEKLAADPQSSLYPSLNYANMHSGGNMASASSSFSSLNNSSMGGMNMGGMGGGGSNMTPHQVQQAAQSLSNMMRSFNNLGSGINN
ncbi:NOVA1 [Bugula neritina]|uniref:NOVA1 n=1 Tax=Bugula neritina TaxID=10212 RepID=A0A7J7JKV2_BUGNE|nr:NOVA1 [Bugula neritina]